MRVNTGFIPAVESRRQERGEPREQPEVAAHDPTSEEPEQHPFSVHASCIGSGLALSLAKTAISLTCLTLTSWRLSNTLDASFCVEALHEALERHGPPEIFNSDQGSQFTSVDFTDVLTEAGIRISMDGKGRWMDNVLIERLWRSLKYECVYLSEFATGSQARTGIGGWLDFYDRYRPHSSLNARTPDEAYTNDGADTSPGLRPVSCQPNVA